MAIDPWEREPHPRIDFDEPLLEEENMKRPDTLPGASSLFGA